MAITFDDGYRDNFLHAFPVLKNLGMPVTIFLTTGCVESGELPWYDRICLAFKLTTRPRFLLEPIGGPKVCIDDRSQRLQAMGKTLAWLRSLNEAEKADCLPQIFEALGAPPYLGLPNAMLNWDEVRQISKRSIAFGAHTASHPVLAKLSQERLERKSWILKKPPRIVYNSLSSILLILSDDRSIPWESEIGSFAMKLDWLRLVGVRRQEVGGGSTGELMKVRTMRAEASSEDLARRLHIEEEFHDEKARGNADCRPRMDFYGCGVSDEHLQMLLRAAGSLEGKRVLDFGCGLGYTSQLVYRARCRSCRWI